MKLLHTSMKRRHEKMGQKITGWSNNGHRSYTFSKADCWTTSATTIATKNEQLRRVPFYILSTIQQGDGWTKAWLCVRCALNHYFIIFMNWKFTHYANSTMCMIPCCGTKSNSRVIGRCQWERKPNSDHLHLHTQTHTHVQIELYKPSGCGWMRDDRVFFEAGNCDWSRRVVHRSLSLTGWLKWATIK